LPLNIFSESKAFVAAVSAPIEQPYQVLDATEV
jgi:hypothetical protein